MFFKKFLINFLGLSRFKTRKSYVNGRWTRQTDRFGICKNHLQQVIFLSQYLKMSLIYLQKKFFFKIFYWSTRFYNLFILYLVHLFSY